jgi:hypothetical protein
MLETGRVSFLGYGRETGIGIQEHNSVDRRPRTYPIKDQVQVSRAGLEQLVYDFDSGIAPDGRYGADSAKVMENSVWHRT